MINKLLVPSFLLLVLSLLVGACVSQATSDADTDFLIAFTNDNHGEIAPCG